MSWFSFGQEFYNSWNSYGRIQKLVSGQFIADYIFDTHLVPCQVYKNIKQKAAESFSEHAKSHFSDSSRPIATRILKKHLTYNVLSSVIHKITAEASAVTYNTIKAKLGFSAHLANANPEQTTQEPTKEKDLSNPPFIRPVQKNEDRIDTFANKPISFSRVVRIRNYLNKNYDPKDSEELKALLKQWRMKDFVLLSIQLSLRPICEKAVLEAIGFASKTSIDLGVDLATKEVISAVSLPLLSHLFSTAAAWTSYFIHEEIDNNYMGALGASAVSYLPSTATILSVSTAYHLGQVGYIWYSTYTSKSAIREDKRRVKELARKLVQQRLAEKIQNNPVTKKLGLKLSQATVNKIAGNLIEEATDNYWGTLKATSFFGMPLVL